MSRKLTTDELEDLIEYIPKHFYGSRNDTIELDHGKPVYVWTATIVGKHPWTDHVTMQKPVTITLDGISCRKKDLLPDDLVRVVNDYLEELKHGERQGNSGTEGEDEVSTRIWID